MIGALRASRKARRKPVRASEHAKMAADRMGLRVDYFMSQYGRHDAGCHDRGTSWLYSSNDVWRTIGGAADSAWFGRKMARIEALLAECDFYKEALQCLANAYQEEDEGKRERWLARAEMKMSRANPEAPEFTITRR